MRRLLAVPFAILALPAAAQDGPITITPEQIAEIFCIARIGNDMAPVEGLLSESLTAAIAEAEAKNDVIAAAAPDEKPPLGDGIPWQTWPDYAAECEPGAVTLTMDRAEVQVLYGFPDSPGANFADKLELTLVEDPTIGTGRWRIDNVVYAEQGDLRSAMIGAFAQ
jgi:hypothetical protein